jgi:hypothetical protein
MGDEGATLGEDVQPLAGQRATRAPPQVTACVKGTRVTLLSPYLHRPTRQGEVFASLFVKPPTTGAASAESYDLYS